MYILGVGVHPWGKYPDEPQVALAVHALDEALADAGSRWTEIGGLVAASSRFEGGLGWGLHANEILQAVAETGATTVNVGGGCAAGGIAVHVAAGLVASGEHDIVAAVGAERMPKGFIARPPGAADSGTDHDYLRWVAVGATNPAYWALEATRRTHEVGTSAETYALASTLMRRNGAANPNARFRTPTRVSEVLASPMVTDPLHLLEICAVSDGAAAVILGTREQADRLGSRAIRIAGSAVASGKFGDPAVRVPTVSQTLGSEGSGTHTSEVAGAVDRALEKAALGRADIDVLEIADNTAWHLLAWPEMLGFVEPGQSDWMVTNDQFAIDGRLPVNPSGGFLSFGEATTAQGVLQVCQLVEQLRGDAGGRQVRGARTGLSAVLGLGGNGASIALTR